MLAGIEELQRVARSGRVGEPVFVRCLVRCEPAMAENAVVEALAAAAAVIGDRPRTLFARGELGTGTLHAVLDFASGPAALVAAGPGEPSWDAMLIGNHGAAYLDSGGCTPGYVPPLLRSGPESTGRWASTLRRALAAGGPVPAEASDE